MLVPLYLGLCTENPKEPLFDGDPHGCSDYCTHRLKFESHQRSTLS